MTRREMLTSLRSEVWPVCGGAKRVARPLCLPCYRRLDEGTREALYQRIGEGYEASLEQALRQLGAHRPHLPEVPA